MKIFHGTTKDCINNIFNFGFKKGYGRYGYAVYFTDNINHAKKFCRTIKHQNIFSAEILDEHITYINSKKIDEFLGLTCDSKNLNIAYEYIDKIIQNKNIKCICVQFETFCEVVVYDTRILKNIMLQIL